MLLAELVREGLKTICSCTVHEIGARSPRSSRPCPPPYTPPPCRRAAPGAALWSAFFISSPRDFTKRHLLMMKRVWISSCNIDLIAEKRKGAMWPHFARPSAANRAPNPQALVCRVRALPISSHRRFFARRTGRQAVAPQPKTRAAIPRACILKRAALSMAMLG